MTEPKDIPLKPGRMYWTEAFSLLELLVVMAVIALVAAMAVPAMNSLMRAYQLDSASQSVVAQLATARQSALSSSHPVQVRFYYLPNYNTPGSSPPTVYRAMQCFVEGDPPATGSPTLKPITRPQYFPAPVVISAPTTPAVSPMLPSTPISAVGTDPKLGDFQSNYKYALFHFKPDGSTDLVGGSNYLTLVLSTDKTLGNNLPANYQTVLVEPIIGSVRIFRP